MESRPSPLVAANMELPKIFVGKYLAQHPSYLHMRDDLLSEAYEALLVEAREFDPNGSASFQTRAWWRMRSSAIALVRSQFGATAARNPQAANELPTRDDSDTAAYFSDPGERIDAINTWEEVKAELQSRPIARGRGFMARRPGEAEDYLNMEFGGLTLRNLADRRGVTPQTVHEQAVRMRAEFLREWPEARNWFEARGEAANEET